MSSVIRSTKRFSTIEMEGCFREAAADQGITIEELRKAQTLPIDFVYSLLEVVSTRSVISELRAAVKSLDLANHQVRQIAATIETPSAIGTAQAGKPAELNAREIRLLQGLLKDRSDAVQARIADIEKTIEVE